MDNFNFNKKEILRFAIGMEESGVRFYTELAKKTKGHINTKVLALAYDEQRHADLFTEWLSKLDEQNNDYLFSEEMSDFFNAFAKSVGFNDSRDENVPDDVLQAIDLGIETEEATIDFYAKLVEFADDATKEQLQMLIAEEQKHSEILNVFRNTFI